MPKYSVLVFRVEYDTRFFIIVNCTDIILSKRVVSIDFILVSDIDADKLSKCLINDQLQHTSMSADTRQLCTSFNNFIHS